MSMYNELKKVCTSPRRAMGMASPLAVAPPGPALLWPLCASFSLLLVALAWLLPGPWRSWSCSASGPGEEAPLKPLPSKRKGSTAKRGRAVPVAQASGR